MCAHAGVLRVRMRAASTIADAAQSLVQANELQEDDTPLWKVQGEDERRKGRRRQSSTRGLGEDGLLQGAVASLKGMAGPDPRVLVQEVCLPELHVPLLHVMTIVSCRYNLCANDGRSSLSRPQGP